MPDTPQMYISQFSALVFNLKLTTLMKNSDFEILSFIKKILENLLLLNYFHFFSGKIQQTFSKKTKQITIVLMNCKEKD